MPNEIFPKRLDTYGLCLPVWPLYRLQLRSTWAEVLAGEASQLNISSYSSSTPEYLSNTNTHCLDSSTVNHRTLIQETSRLPLYLQPLPCIRSRSSDRAPISDNPTKLNKFIEFNAGLSKRGGFTKLISTFKLDPVPLYAWKYYSLPIAVSLPSDFALQTACIARKTRRTLNALANMILPKEKKKRKVRCQSVLTGN